MILFLKKVKHLNFSVLYRFLFWWLRSLRKQGMLFALFKRYNFARQAIFNKLFKIFWDELNTICEIVDFKHFLVSLLFKVINIVGKMELGRFFTILLMRNKSEQNFKWKSPQSIKDCLFSFSFDIVEISVQSKAIWQNTRKT